MIRGDMIRTRGRLKSGDFADAAETPTHLIIITNYVMPGGTATVKMGNSYETVRVCLGVLEAEDGILAEIESGQKPRPWQNNELKRKAMAELRNGNTHLDDETRRLILRHIVQAPYFQTGHPE